MHARRAVFPRLSGVSVQVYAVVCMRHVCHGMRARVWLLDEALSRAYACMSAECVARFRMVRVARHFHRECGSLCEIWLLAPAGVGLRG